MAQKTNLNVSPYYDDFTESNNFVKTLFRPGFAVQARELTQIQSYFQNQVERHGRHIFAEGAMVIPGQINFIPQFPTLKLKSTFGTETIDPSQYYNATTAVTITGATTGVTAEVIGYTAGTTTDQPLLHLRYVKTGTDNLTSIFADGENISADAGITHNTSYASNVASATTYTSAYSSTIGSSEEEIVSATGPAARSGTAVHISDGIYYIRGHFVQCNEETLVLDAYRVDSYYRVGFDVTETLVTPESDTTLLDNATGSSNYAAKGAHRLQLELSLKKLARDSTNDSNFVQLMDIRHGQIQSAVRQTDYSVLEETFARRTFDESGDYTVRPFQFKAIESINQHNNGGAYTAGATTDEGAIASEDLLVLKVSPGKAYVKGYEIEKISPAFKDLAKARDFNTVNAGISRFDLGNYALITNIYGSPDIGIVTGETTAFKKVQLYDDVTSTRGTATGNLIGVARARGMEYSSGTAGSTSSNTSAEYKLYLFDIRPFTRLTLSGTPSPTLLASHSTGGVQLIDNSTDATGFVFADGTSENKVNLINVAGNFTVGNKIKASDSAETGQLIEDSGNTDLTITAIETFNFSNVRSVYMQDPDSGQDFTADFVLTRASGEDGSIAIDGTDAGSANANDQIILNASDSGGTDAGSEILLEGVRLARLKDTEKNVAIIKLPKRVVKTLLTTTNAGASDTQYTVKRQFVATSNASGVVTFTAGTNETFVSHSEADYTMSILTAGDGSGSVGDVVSIASTSSISGAQLTVTDDTVLGDSAKVKLIGTILKTSVTQKAKTTNLMKQVKVTTGATDAYGTRPTDKTISLGRADVFDLVAVFDSGDTSDDASAPYLTLTDATGTFTRGEIIIGSSSKSYGRIIDVSSPMSYVLLTISDFTANETITGQSSGTTAVVSEITVGSTAITSRYLLDTGQRDNFYDISRIVRKTGVSPPTGRLLIVYNYLEHGAGDMLTVDSYTANAGAMTYGEIPFYSATKVDPDAPKPTGEFPLIDSYDFRPRVADIAGTSSTLATVDEITGNSFDFESRVFSGTGSSTVNFPKPNSNIQSDFEYYLPKRAVLAMNSRGNLVLTEGASAENPMLPKVNDSVMKLCEVILPPYTFSSDDVKIIRHRNQRYTMKDIGELERRIDHVEYYTALNMLEREAESFEVTDANGLNRFKAGFVVDNFTGHRIGDSQHKDYKISMDISKGELRPIHKTKAIKLEENISTDAARASAGYQKTGSLITLPYTEESFTSQPFATRVERVTPFLTSSWVGVIELDPSGDEWFETEIAPELIINVDGNFDAVANANENQLGTIWNSWQTIWSGVISQTSERLTGEDRFVRDTRNTGPGTAETVTLFSGNDLRGSRVTGTTETRLQRTGIRTEVVEQIDRESLGFRVISRGLVPIMRQNTIEFTGVGFRPNTRLYTFFDKVAVSAHITPSDGYSLDETTVEGSGLVTGPSGKVVGTFLIPDPKVAGNITFNTGEVEFRLTSSTTNKVGNQASAESETTEAGLADDLTTAGSTIYFANGILETEQETIIATRNAIITRTTLTETDTQFRTDTWFDAERGINFSDNIRVNVRPAGREDPLAQTFKVEAPTRDIEGKFITSIDIYFSDVDDLLGVTCEIRNTVNGYPGKKVLPFGRKVLEPSEISVSDDASVATTFTFPSPVFVKNNTEYCFVLLADVPTYKVWISRMGETEVGGTREVSAQPHIGILFKSHNNTGWAPSPLEDLKFDIKTADFNTTDGVCTLQNTELPALTLRINPIVMNDDSDTRTLVKIKHPNHQMYSTSNNVTIAGVSAENSTTLDGAITIDATELSLSSGTNFDDIAGKWASSDGTATGTRYIKIDDEIMTYTTIATDVISNITRAQSSTTAAEHADGATVEFYQMHRVPLTEINKTHTAISNMSIDDYTITISTTPVTDGGGGFVEFGGDSVTVTENSVMDMAGTIISTMELPKTALIATLQPTTSTSPSGSETSFSKVSSANAFSISLNDNFKFDVPYMVSSAINETNEMSGVKSVTLPITLRTATRHLSPVIDTERMSLLTVSNRINNIDSAAVVAAGSGVDGGENPQGVWPDKTDSSSLGLSFTPSTSPEGDNNAAIYLTKRVALENPATALKIIFAAHRPATAEIKLMYKILRTDDASDFDDLGYVYFNSTGGADLSVPPSLDENDFQEYIHTAGVTDDGLGTPLDEFISFQIKIILQSISSAEPPRLKDLRCLALVT